MRVETFIWWCPIWAAAFGVWLYICRLKTAARKLWKYAAIAYAACMVIFWKTTMFYLVWLYYGLVGQDFTLTR